MRSATPVDLSRLHALVPVRGLADGKGRLGFALDAEERETLIVGMLARTLDVLAGWPACERVCVATSDEMLLRIARSRGADAVADPATGLNGALEAARDAAVARDATAVLCLPADLPFLATEALERMLDAADAAIAAGGGRPIVVAAPADARDGTNALLLAPPDVIRPAFGGYSLAAHARAADEAGASLQLVVDPQLGFDLDTPDDLERIDVAQLLELMRVGQDCLSTEPAFVEPA